MAPDLCTCQCSPRWFGGPSVKLLKVHGLIQDSDKSAFKWDVEEPTLYSHGSLELKTVDMSVEVNAPCWPSGLQKRSLVWSRICTPPESGNGAGIIITGPSHPEHDLCELLPSGRSCRSLCAKTSRDSRHMNGFSPQAIALTSTQPCDMFWFWTNKM